MTSTTEKRLVINLMSFGYRYGLPPEADIVLDVRFLPNPYFIEELKHLNGPRRKNPGICHGVGGEQTFLEQLPENDGIPDPSLREGGKVKPQRGMAVQAASTAPSSWPNRLASYFAGENYLVNTAHRDIHRA